MNRHIDPRILARGHNPVEKIHEIVKQFFVRNLSVFLQNPVQLLRRIAFVPARQVQIFRVQL